MPHRDSTCDGELWKSYRSVVVPPTLCLVRGNLSEFRPRSLSELNLSTVYTSSTKRTATH